MYQEDSSDDDEPVINPLAFLKMMDKRKEEALNEEKKKEESFLRYEPINDDVKTSEYIGNEGDCDEEVNTERLNDDRADNAFILSCTRKDIKSVLQAEDMYKSVDDFIEVMTSFIRAEYAYALKHMEGVEIMDNPNLSFKLLMKKEIEKGKNNFYYIFGTTIDVPKRFIDKDSNGLYSSGHVNQGDKAIIHFPEIGKKVLKVDNVDIEFEKAEIHLTLNDNEIDMMRKNKLYKLAESTTHKLNRYYQMVPVEDISINVVINNIKFQPTDVLIRRRLKALRSLSNYVNSQAIIDTLLGYVPINPNEPCNSDLSDICLTETQKDIVKKATTAPVSIIQGPPGTGKTHVISALAYSILQQYPNDRILLCGTSNQSVENMVIETAKKVESLGKKLVWFATEGKDFKINEDITREQSYLMFNLMINRKSTEGRQFAELQKHVDSLSFYERSKANILRKKLEENIASESNVVCCTLETSGKKCLDKLIFKTVIVDESTQATEPSTLIPLIHRAERLILVGDQRQLGPIIPRDDILKYKNFDRSLFERCVENGFEPLLLDTQFRMHPDISAFSNANFYQGRLKDRVSKKERELTTYVIKDHITFLQTDGKEEMNETSFYNKAELERVIKLINDFLSSGVYPEDIGVISPYSAQVKALRREFKNQYMDGKCPNVKIGSVDSFQGSQKEYIIISTVRSGLEVGFLSDERRLNVAVTRARIAVIVVGNSRAISNDKHWKNLVTYCKEELNSYYTSIEEMRQMPIAKPQKKPCIPKQKEIKPIKDEDPLENTTYKEKVQTPLPKRKFDFTTISSPPKFMQPKITLPEKSTIGGVTITRPSKAAIKIDLIAKPKN